MNVDPDGRYLVALAAIVALRPPVVEWRFAVVRGFELAAYQASGWGVVAEDPCPHYFAPFARNEDDGA